ncbi:MAG: protein kinase [Erysipelotrichaceae bacterium]|nr:protein kinase [Erysipelotrichaceae bacterium]
MSTEYIPLNKDKTVIRYYDESFNCYVVEKSTETYNTKVYEYLYRNHIDGIPEILSIDNKEDKLAVKEKWIDGINLEKYIETKGKLDEVSVCNMMIGLCTILEKLHEHKIIHRDIKPSNVIYNGKDVNLIDFNIAKFENNDESRDTVLLGTKGYAAPEQYGFGASGIETDIYGVGRLMEYLLNGDLDVNTYKGKLNKIIDKCTKIERKDRFKDVSVLKNYLEYLLKKIDRRSIDYTPVGFRSKTVWKMLVAGIMYLLVFGIIVNIESSGSLWELWVTRLLVFTVFMSLVCFNFNYIGIRDGFDFRCSPNKYIRFIQLILVNILIVIVQLFIYGYLLVIFA